MTRRLAAIWRFPVKSHGRESLPPVDPAPGQRLPRDSTVAVDDIIEVL